MITSEDSPDFWDKKYLENSAGWDMGTPTPFFVSLLEEGKHIIPGSLFVPGCGKGYDAVYAAQKGFKVTAADFSEKAISFARGLADEKGVNINFVNEDIFQLKMESSFDYIFEYVTYCAINPARRDEYAQKMVELLKPGGKLIALLFPLDDRPGGPPYGINHLEAYGIFSKYLKLEFYSRLINSIKPRKGREVLHIYKKI